MKEEGARRRRALAAAMLRTASLARPSRPLTTRGRMIEGGGGGGGRLVCPPPALAYPPAHSRLPPPTRAARPRLPAQGRPRDHLERRRHADEAARHCPPRRAGTGEPPTLPTAPTRATTLRPKPARLPLWSRALRCCRARRICSASRRVGLPGQDRAQPPGAARQEHSLAHCAPRGRCCRLPCRADAGGHRALAGRGGRRRHDQRGGVGRRVPARGQAVCGGRRAPAGDHQGIPPGTARCCARCTRCARCARCCRCRAACVEG